jgi:hypothetical protein
MRHGAAKGRRLIARNEFRNTTNSFNGFHGNLAQQNLWRIRAFMVKPVSDSMRVSKVWRKKESAKRTTTFLVSTV